MPIGCLIEVGDCHREEVGPVNRRALYPAEVTRGVALNLLLCGCMVHLGHVGLSAQPRGDALVNVDEDR